MSTARWSSCGASSWGATLTPAWASVTRLERFTLPETPLLGRTVQPYVDAAHQCLRGNPPPTHAGLANHQCEILTCSTIWARSALCTLPVMVLRSRNTLRGGSKLTYNYDSHLRYGAYTFGPQAAA